MKKSLLLWAIIAIAVTARAADLVVEEYGQAPSYSSIQSALSAASAGDRIFIKNKAGGLPWLENITITQSVDLLAFSNDTFFVIQGNVTVSPSSTSTINIIGMINLGAGISTGSNPTGGRSILRILNGQLAGDITVNNNNFTLIVQGTTTTGINYKHGVIVGNTVGNTGINVSTENVNPIDTNYIFGNITSGTNGINWASTSSVFDIRNNFVSASNYGIYVTADGGGAGVINKIYNNTISMQGYASYEYGMYVAGSAAAQVDVQNNVIDRVNNNGYIYGFYGSISGNLTFTYNLIDAPYTIPISGSLTVNLNNSTSSYTSVNGDGSLQNSLGLDGGNPSTAFYDIDLTPNDIGCYGGSFTLKNFFPQNPNWAMTWLTNYNFSVRTGNTISIKASSYDK